MERLIQNMWNHTYQFMMLPYPPKANSQGLNLESRTAERAMSGFLDKVIQAEEDPRLQGSHQHADTVPEVIQRPPGIMTLRQCGELVIPSGKHAGKTYAEAHKDLG